MNVKVADNYTEDRASTRKRDFLNIICQTPFFPLSEKTDCHLDPELFQQ